MTKHEWTRMPLTICVAAAVANAQPAPDPAPPVPNDGSAAGSGSASAASAVDSAADHDELVPDNPMDEPVAKPKPPAKPRKPDPPVAMPTVIAAPTGWLLPAGVLYSRTGVDTGGGFITDNRVGLGDVAEFGVSSTDQIRAQGMSTDSPKAIQPYVGATFRMGVGENRLFDHQPGLVLGFFKSFDRSQDDATTRVAELTLVASEHVGDRVALHVGGSFWDASLTENSTAFSLHDERSGIGEQIRPFGGIQVRPLDKAEILVDVSWAPQFCYQCTNDRRIELRPQLSWGVRYEVAPWMRLESGVRVPDIASANLLDAQIYGQVTFTSFVLAHAVHGD